ncbi:MAG TPA: hypothetical protein VMM81_06445 [Acidimicrobiia bacterium]|nr:hypothetical protein [Acidimicrobiia bacterium]
MSEPIDALLLLALPASGKSEVRRYLEQLPPDVCTSDMRLRPTIQVDDYPYVHLMRRISEEQLALGLEPSFFASADDPFIHSGDWLTLIHLLNEDVAGLGMVIEHDPDPAALLDRFDRARSLAGVTSIEQVGRSDLAAAITEDAATLAGDLPVVDQDRLDGSSLLIEFARGGPEGATLPLDPPLGYQHSLAELHPVILDKASILYVWVTPEESRRRNHERALPGPEGDASILHHGVPEAVMLGDYGTDDMDWLEETSPVPGTIEVDRGAMGRHRLPFARFDNREDLTSFLRGDPDDWPSDDVERLHTGLAAAFGELADRQSLRS